MTLEQFAGLVRNMRSAQSDFFENRSGTKLKLAKKLEGQVDEILKKIPMPPPPKQYKQQELL